MNPLIFSNQKVVILFFLAVKLTLFASLKIYPSLDQYNWSCAWCPIPEHHHTLTLTKEIH